MGKSKPRVKVECGTVDPSYRGVVNPQLKTVYLQTEAERAKYEPIMKKLLEEGLPETGGQISGI